jgi:hypothetical protein
VAKTRAADRLLGEDIGATAIDRRSKLARIYIDNHNQSISR